MTRTRITYFVHSTTTDNEKGIATGWAHGKLSKLGRKQSLQLKKLVRNRKFDAVFCSDLKRAVDSARIVFGKNIIRDRRLRECDYGDFEGKQSKVVDNDMARRIIRPFPKGESYKDVEKRIREFLKDVLRNYSGRHVAIVSHRAPQLALDVILKGKNWKTAMKEDWRHKKRWKPGWIYNLKMDNL